MYVDVDISDPIKIMIVRHTRYNIHVVVANYVTVHA